MVHAGADTHPHARADSPAVITLSGIRKTYGTGDNTVEALKGVDFEAHPNRMTAIVGPSGSGKSTLLNLIGGLDTPTSGSIRFEGRDITRLGEAERTRFRARNIGFVFQFLNLLPGLTCEQNVMLGGVIVGMPPREARSRAGELLEIVGLGDKRRRAARELSGGQMQRVAIARALINDAPLLLADEPTGNLDEKNAEEITSLLRDRATDGRAVVLVTHNSDLAERYADEVRIVRDGLINDQQSAEIRELAPAPSAEPSAPLHVDLNPTGNRAGVPDQLVADLALELAQKGGHVRLSRGPDGRVVLGIDGP
ncbi:MAG: ABC transporter ATP-binding protein [Thermoleophilia bacterium]|nr:ABC transporter ATP-binding protein [Thermoleophilia bacterium]